ncbi:MAG: phosphohistidine phosphatase SixA [Ignavibacteriae bacterium]|nr:phosphohistidine phosphatase SixA [Ignavibacteria bacterium]MBI3364406.1 phosphohistidine phosphatase SixA [Ignavibacteriota bacterium]
MLLLLLRHGDALDTALDGDALRPLSPHGEEQARAQGNLLQSLALQPDIILTSPLLRAQQTAEIVRQLLGVATISMTEHLTPSSDHRQTVQQLNALGKERVLLVGHEPHLGTFISLLVTGSRNAQIEMKKGSLACVDIEVPVRYGEGNLVWLFTAAASISLFR